MPFWQRISITLAAMIAVSFVAGLLWSQVFGFALPSYVAGVIGGLTALPLWEFTRRVGPRKSG